MYSIAICDDENSYIEQIEEIVWKAMDEYEEKIDIYKLSSCEALCSLLQKVHIDLIFLDIEMRGMNGIKAGHYIRETLLDDIVQIVYITGKEGYERELFDVQPLNFIEKPLDVKKLKKCIMLAYQKLLKGKRRFYYVKKYEMIYVSWNEIICFRTKEKVIELVSIKGNDTFKSSMNEVEQKLTGGRFIRISQSVIVNMDYVKVYDGKEMLMSDGERYQVSRTLRKEVKIIYGRLMIEKGEK